VLGGFEGHNNRALDSCRFCLSCLRCYVGGGHGALFFVSQIYTRTYIDAEMARSMTGRAPVVGYGPYYLTTVVNISDMELKCAL